MTSPRPLPPIVIVAQGATVPPEAEPLIATLRAKVIRSSDLVLWLRHLAHALIDPPPLPRSSSLIDSRPAEMRHEVGSEHRESEPGRILCRACSGEMCVSQGTGPHAARGDCVSCGAWRWVSRAELGPAVISATVMLDDAQLTLGDCE